MMENRLFIIITILLPAFCTVTGYSVQNHSLSNPAGSTTTPQSYNSRSLVNTSNSINTNGNEIVTGNVRRGMHFRGDVPYSSTSSFNASLGSSTLSSFMRDSAGSEDISGRSKYKVGSAGTNYQSYYLPSSTVTTMSQNTPGIASTGNTTINNGSQYLSGSQVSQNQPVISSQNTQAQSTTLWHLYNPGLAGTQSRNNTLSQMRSESSSSRPNEQQTRQENGKYQQDETAAYQQYMQQSLRTGTPDGQTNPNTIQNTRDNQQYVENRATATQPLAELPLYSSQQTAEQNNQWQQSLSPSRYDIQETASSTTTSQPASANMQQFAPPQRGYQTLATGEFDTTGERAPLTSGLPGTLNRYGPATENTTIYQPNTGPARTSAPQYQRQINRYPSTQDTETTETLAQIQRQLDDLIRSIDSRYQTSTFEATQSGTAEQEMHGLPQTGTSYRNGQINQGLSGQNEYGRNQTLTGLSDTSQSQGSQYGTSRLTELKEMSQAEISARAQRIMGQYEDYESFSQAKYNQLYRAAEGHLNIGRFNQAADTFALASIYKPEDPLCYAGRAHALFAAGEYVSSALHLIRAIELDPEYTQTQIDLAELVGGPDKLDSKTADLKNWLQKSHAPGLGFLLGYVYYHTGRFNEAKQVMDVVMQEMPRSKAATALKMTIELKLTTQQ